MIKKIHQTFRALKSKNYRLYFIGQSVSFLGTWIQQAAMGWLVYRLTNSAFMLGLIALASQLPAFLLSPFVGVLSDKIDRRKLLIMAQTAFMIQAGVLTFLVLTGLVNEWHILGLSLFLGVISGFEMTTRHTFFIDVIEKKDDLGNAIALNSMVFNGSRLVGPLLAGVLIAFAGEGICFLLNTISYTAVIFSLFLIKTKRPEKMTTLKDIYFLKEIREGLEYAFFHKPLRYLILLMGAVFIFALPFSTFLPAFAKDVLKGDPGTLGLLMSSMGAGAFAGAIFLASRKTVQGLGKILTGAALVMGLALVGFCLSDAVFFSMAALVFAGVGVMIFNSSVNTLLQVLSDESKRGRVVSIYIMAFTGLVPLGGLIQGCLDGIWGIRLTILAGVLCSLVCTGIFAMNLKKINGPISEKLKHLAIPNPES